MAHISSAIVLTFLTIGTISGPVSQGTGFAAAIEQTYDYVIVGGGLTGLVVANRLSEDKTKSVIVVENGYIDDSPATSIPYMAGFVNTEAMYPITSAAEPHLNNLTFPVRVGNVVGGGSVVNGMMFDRGSNADYDAWKDLGNEDWGWEGLEPYFKKSTHFTPPSESSCREFGITYNVSAYGSGPLQVSIPSFQYPDYAPIFKSWRAENISMPTEAFLNPLGAFWAPNTVDNTTATRSHARKAYYDPVQSRTNLKLLSGTHIDEILFDDKNTEKIIASGVKITSRIDGSTTKLYASKEVILAAGGIFTPHLLMVSGIGPRDILAAANVTVKKDMPAVGSNFQDHVPAYMSFNLSNRAFPNPDSVASNASFNASAAVQYEESRSGPWSVGRGNALAFLTFKQFSSNYQLITSQIPRQKAIQFLPEQYSKSRALLAGFEKQREILMKEYLGDDAAVGEFGIQPSGRATASIQKPLSRGTLKLNTTHPQAFPIVQWNALQNPIDKAVLGEAVRWNRKHWARKELSQYSPVETAPGVQYQSDDEIVEGCLKTNALQPSFSHPSGSCPMMPEELGGCVSGSLLVYGIQKLSIVDASIIPMIPAAHLQATMYAVAEKAADIIKGRSKEP
ncbi:alcohol oxidase [Lindgomyces ingoldianus]|uniref:Alcohol oxidase n=1 Tax=Lindgomyces ingoldianus TaxID=673940 RepID=A0ACB6R6L9_9PLEO|nr:alcohol oxidase [Lindgomyces ingoldianus]KAF2474899.1 alcohol oxidase [Lindgomyces ingoldianus]